MLSSQSSQQGFGHPLKASLIWSLAAVSFGYAFFQRVAPSVIVSDLMAEFAVGAGVLGQLSGLYFYPYVALQPVLGALLERAGARTILSMSLIIGAIGSWLFADAETLSMAFVGRALIGTGAAAAFICSLSLASRWFAPSRFSLLAGGAMFFAMMCGVFAQAPLAALVNVFGWRMIMFAAGVFAAVMAILVAVIVRNGPVDVKPAKSASRPAIAGALKAAAGNRYVWLVSMIALAMTGPMLAFGGLWGVPYTMQAYGLDRTAAAFQVSFVLVGWAVGAPLIGWMADKIALRRAPLLLTAVANTVLLTIVLYVAPPPIWLVAPAYFAIGFMGAGMVNCFALARELTPSAIHGASTGIVNGMTVASGAIFQPLVGVVLDINWDGRMANGVRVFSLDDYRVALVALVVASGLAAVLVMVLPETRCRPLKA